MTIVAMKVVPPPLAAKASIYQYYYLYCLGNLC